MLTFTEEELELLSAAMIAKNITPSFDELIKLVNRSKAVGLPAVKKESKVLRLISQEENIIIKACDGKATLANTKEVFPSGIDSDFKNWGLDNSSSASLETAAEVYELIKDANFAQMFKSFGVELDSLCLTQNQIKDFCVENAQWLRSDGYATLFLFRKDEQKPATPANLFVARVRVRSVGLYVGVNRFEGDGVWFAEYRHRVVLPQLTV